jgi:hypothetical protein
MHPQAADLLVCDNCGRWVECKGDCKSRTMTAADAYIAIDNALGGSSDRGTYRRLRKLALELGMTHQDLQFIENGFDDSTPFYEAIEILADEISMFVGSLAFEGEAR